MNELARLGYDSISKFDRQMLADVIAHGYAGLTEQQADASRGLAAALAQRCAAQMPDVQLQNAAQRHISGRQPFSTLLTSSETANADSTAISGFSELQEVGEPFGVSQIDGHVDCVQLAASALCSFEVNVHNLKRMLNEMLSVSTDLTTPTGLNI